jgi:polysaccharide biosynthesis/export protein
MKKNKLIFSFLIPLAMIMSSCSTQNLFMSDKKETDNSILKSASINNFEHKLKADDKISISVWNHDDMSMGSIFGIYNSNEVYGKWQILNADGFVNLPQIGMTCLSGMTADEAGNFLSGIYSEYILDPIIVVKVLNHKVTILGEVKNPGNFILDEGYNNVVECLAMAGGLNFFAEKAEIKLIREYQANAQEYIIDLTSMDRYNLSNVRILPGDVLYVPAKGAKSFERRSSILVSLAGVLSATAIVFSVFSK